MLYKLNLTELIYSYWNLFWFCMRSAIRFKRSGYSEASPSNLPFVAEAQSINERYDFQKTGIRLFPRHWIRNLATLYILEDMFEKIQFSKSLNILEPCCQDFVRLPALRSFFKAQGVIAKFTGIEIDAFVPLRGFHSRWDHAHYYLSLVDDGSQYLDKDFFKFKGQADLIICFYPFISTSPALAWGLPANVANPYSWVKSFESNLVENGMVLVVHQGSWEEDVFDIARKNSKLKIIKRKIISCPFFPAKHPMHATLYIVDSKS